MIAFSPKTPTEEVALSVNFAELLASVETISTASVAISVHAGTDAAAASMVSGSAIISGAEVTQMIIDGLDGVYYKLVYTITTSAGQTLQETATLSVRVQT